MMFLDLPAEIRNNIYDLLLRPSANITSGSEGYTDYDYHDTLGLAGVNKQIRAEAQEIFRLLNTFIAVDTPWRDAESHVQFEGHVPIICAGPRAHRFKQWTMLVKIRAPAYILDIQDGLSERFIIHINDLEKFCTTWWYSDLSAVRLNKELTVDFALQDTRTLKAEWEEPKLSKAMQQRLLLPFGKVKDLQAVTFSGTVQPFKSVREEMHRLMQEPNETPASCLIRATAFKDEGNTAFRDGKYDDALECYRKSWEAMHIVVNGRHRHIHADEWYNCLLQEKPFVGMPGHSVRLALRVKLVANTVQVYLKMEQWEEAIFWGMRTIRMVRQAAGLREDEEADTPQEEAFLSFFSAADVGKIYYRTAMAFKATDDMFEARKLLKVAQVYLPRDRRVAEEVMASAPRI